jgi:hypothetical protein
MGSHDAALLDNTDPGAEVQETLCAADQPCLFAGPGTQARLMSGDTCFAGDIDELLKLHVREAVRSKLQKGPKRALAYSK